MIEFCTITDEAYGDRVEILYHSMKKWCGDFILRLLTLDQASWERFGARTRFDRIAVVTYDSFISNGLAALESTRSRPEYVWTLKPWWIKHCFSFGAGEQVIYVDGDMCFFAPIETLLNEVMFHNIAITPHRFSKNYQHYLINGNFNGAFIWMRKNIHAFNCVKEWAEQCAAWCFLKHEEDKFVDQKYLNAWPTRWGAHSIAHKGVNLAPWNQGEGHYTYEVRDNLLFVDGDPVVLYHFHEGLKTAYPICPAVRRFIYDPWSASLKNLE